ALALHEACDNVLPADGFQDLEGHAEPAKSGDAGSHARALPSDPAERDAMRGSYLLQAQEEELPGSPQGVSHGDRRARPAGDVRIEAQRLSHRDAAELRGLADAACDRHPSEDVLDEGRDLAGLVRFGGAFAEP